MAIRKIFAHVSCSDLEASMRWYETLFGKPPTSRPMPGLAEWDFTESAALQLFEDAGRAGASTLTLSVSGLGAEHERLAAAGLQPAAIEPATHFSIFRLRDPDRNLVVLAGEPHGS